MNTTTDLERAKIPTKRAFFRPFTKEDDDDGDESPSVCFNLVLVSNKRDTIINII